MDASTLRLGVIGLGALGSRIATRLIRSGFNPQIYDIADVSLRLFNNDVGGIITGSPKIMAQSCDVIIAVLPSAADLREVAFGWEGLARGFANGGVLVDMGVSDPKETIALARELAARGIDLVDAPARGTPAEAKDGKLSFLVGGPDAAVERCGPIFAALGHVRRAGVAGSGQAEMALGEFVRASMLLAASEALQIGARCGLDTTRLLDTAEGLGGLGPAMAALLRQQVLSRGFDSGLALGHVLKGLDTAAALAQAGAVEAPLLAACRAAWAAASDRLGSGADQTALVRWLETLAPSAPQGSVAQAKAKIEPRRG